MEPFWQRKKPLEQEIMGDLYQEPISPMSNVETAQTMRPDVKQYLTEKYKIGQQRAPAQEAAAEPLEAYDPAAEPTPQTEQSGGGFDWQAGLVGLGRVLQQKSPGEGIIALQKNRADEQERQIQQGIRERETDPNSQESDLARQLASTMLPGYDFSKMNAAQINSRFPNLQRIYEAKLRQDEQKLRREEMQAAMGLRRADQMAERAAKQEEKDAQLMTPFGKANTPDDAKQLKEGIEAKKNFDEKIQEMIRLREKHGGGAILNREDVERGKQLSKDLLLQYKNMAKLGVLSKADEDIINAIIPADPLAYNDPISFVSGQDPTLNRLKKFKEDSEKDFATKVSTRTRGGSYEPQLSSPSPASASGLTPEQRRARIEELRRKAGK